jgi:hypothetical protein
MYLGFAGDFLHSPEASLGRIQVQPTILQLLALPLQQGKVEVKGSVYGVTGLSVMLHEHVDFQVAGIIGFGSPNNYLSRIESRNPLIL